MSFERTIAVKLVIDDAGSPRLKAIVDGMVRDLSAVTGQAGAVGQALATVRSDATAAGQALGAVGAGAATAQQALTGVAQAAQTAAGAQAKLAQGSRDLDQVVASALERGTQRVNNYEDAIQRALGSTERLGQTTQAQANAHVRAYQASNQSVNNLSAAVDRLLNQRSRWDQSLSQIFNLGGAYQKAGQLAGQAGETIARGARAGWEATKRLGSDISDLTGKIFTLRNAAIGLATVWIFNHAVKPGLGFNETIESAQLGIASLLTSTMELRDQTGQLMPLEAKYAEAKRVSATETDKLRIAGLATVATTEQLVEAYQQGVGPLTKAGVALGDVQKITVGIVQAAGALGMPMAQVNEEVRSIAEGTINMNSRVAKTLGISNEMVASWKAQNQLATELNKRLEAFTVSGQEAMDTWRGIKSNMADALGYLSGKATEGLFEGLKSGWKGLLDQIFDIDLKSGKFDISATFQPTIDSLKRIFSGLGDWVDQALRGIPDKIAGMTAWWERHGEAVQTIASKAYDAVKGIVGGAVTAVEKVLGVLVPDSDRMKSAEEGFRGISESIGAIADHLSKVPTEVWQSLALGVVGGRVAGWPGAAVGASIPPINAAAKWLAEHSGENYNPADPFGLAAYLDRRASDLRVKPGDYAPLPDDLLFSGYTYSSGSNASTAKAGGPSLTPGKPGRNEKQVKALQDLAPWLEGKLAELRGAGADWSGDLVGKVLADRDKATAEIEKKLVDLRQANLGGTDEYQQVLELRERTRREYDAKELDAAAEMKLKRVQFEYETGAATRAELIAASEERLAAYRRDGRGETEEARQAQKAINELRLGGLKYDEAVLNQRIALHQASKRDLVALYQAQAREIEANDKLSQEEKTSLLLEYQQKIQQTNRSIVEDEEKVATLRAELTRDTEAKRILELRQFDRQLEDLGVKGWERDQLLELKRQDLHKSGFRRTLEDLADFSQAYERTTQHMLESVYDGIEGSFEAWLDGTKTWGEAFISAIKQVGIQAAAQFATAFLVSLAAKGVLALFPSIGISASGGAVGGQTSLLGAASDALSLASLGNSAYNAYNWFANGGLSNLALTGPNAIGSGLVNWGLGPTGFTEGGWEMATPLQANGLSGMGYATSGIGGALTGWQVAQMLYGNGTGAQIGGALGGAGGGIAGATIGTLILPGIGTVIGGLLGGAGGGALGGGLGSLFDSEDTRLPYEIPGNYLAHWEELNSRVEYYTEAIQDGSISTEEFLSEFEKMAPLAAGAGEYLGNYGDIIGGTIQKLADMTAGSEDYARVVQEELNPAWIIEEGMHRAIADGMDRRTAAQTALNDAIDAYAAGSSLEASQQDQLIDLIINQAGNVADLTAKYNRYKEIKEQLLNAHNMERGQVEALGKELQALHDELDLADDPMANMVKTVNSFSEAVDKLTAAINALPESKSINISYNQSGNASYHKGGLVMHTGGWVQAALSRGLIDGRGGRWDELPRLHGGGTHPALKYDEVQAILRKKEVVIREEAVNAETLPGLLEINRTGKLPRVPLPVAVPVAAEAAATVVNVQVVLQVQGDVVGDQGALEQIKDAATAGASAGVLAALASRATAGENLGQVRTQLKAPI